ncbi:MAG: hypothetical protein AB7P33_08370 [Dehalococcoidia bacterium]
MEISFEYARADDPSPRVTVHNARILIPSLSDQIVRYGLRHTAVNSATMVGNLQGGRESFIAMIHSYGFKVGPRTLEDE